MVQAARGMLLAAILIVVAACGGASAADPAGSVQAALSAVNGKSISAMTDYTCAAQRANLADSFGASGMAALQQAGVSLGDLMAAINVGVSNVSVKEVSKTATTATVHVTADMSVSFDEQKMRSILTQVLVAQGQAVDNAMLDQAMALVKSQSGATQHIDRDVDVTKEGGKWLICGGGLVGG